MVHKLLHQIPCHCGADHRATSSRSTSKCSLYFVWLTISMFAAMSRQQTVASPCGIKAIPHKIGNSENISGVIVGGVVAAEGSWPWQVQLLYNGAHTCGGTLIDRDWVLSAGHCVVSDDPSKWVVKVGKHEKLVDVAGRTQVFSPSCILTHESFDSFTLQNDISLFRLSSPVEISDHVSLACLPEPGQKLDPGHGCYVTGWGSTEGTGGEGFLKQAYVPTVDAQACVDVYPSGWITDDMICAGYLNSGGIDACQGDSGGPFVCQAGPENATDPFVVFGVTSFGIGCASATYPGVYTRVSNFITWIKDKMDNPPPLCETRAATTGTTTTTGATGQTDTRNNVTDTATTTTATMTSAATTRSSPTISEPSVSSSCFHADSEVTVYPGQHVPITSLKPGHQVLSCDYTKDTFTYSHFIADAHRDLSQRTNFITLITDREKTVQMTPGHLIPTSRGCEDSIRCDNVASIAGAVYSRMADLQVGDTIFVTGNNSRDDQLSYHTERIVEILHHSDVGITAPITSAGTIVVDGVICSSYALFDQPIISHYLIYPLRYLYYIIRPDVIQNMVDRVAQIIECAQYYKMT